ncbi:MAG: hypothetical protein F6K45_12410 [Kamptonema sp. SIO1D9]|nr:hypothetical protein [Kamptonema sp. SIO1D9]
MTTSPIDDIQAAIKKENPFASLAIVREQDIWDGNFPDLESFNAHASNAVFEAINRVRKATSGHNKITSMVITAQKGVGKSHIISRIRRRCKLDGTALFIYAGVETYSLHFINREFQQTLAESLDRIGSQNVTQWQELATFMVNKVLKKSNSEAKTNSAQKLVATLNDSTQPTEKIYRWVGIMTSKFSRLTRSKRIDVDLVRAIFWTLSEEQTPYALKWLSGNDLSPKKAEELELPKSSILGRDSESKAFENISQILSLISDYQAVTICFDELDTVDIRRSKVGLTRTHVVAQLIKSLVDSINLSSESNGIVILTVMMPDTWKWKIKQMPGGVADRVSAANESIQLQFIDDDSIVELVKLWLQPFYQQRNLNPPTEVYPFEENQLRKLGGENSVRRVLQWCRERWYDDNVTPPPVENAYNKELELLKKTRTIWIEEEDKIANALCLGFHTLSGKTVNEFQIERLEKKVEPNKDNKKYIKFKVIGKHKGKTIKLGILVLQKTNSNSVMAGLSRLVAYKKFDLNRGCFVRSRTVSETASKAQENLTKLLSPQYGGIYADFKPEDIEPLLAVWLVYKGRDDYDLKDKDIIDFVDRKKLAIDNILIHKILSEPTGKIPEGLSDD